MRRLLVVLALTGCSKVLGINDVSLGTPDGGTGGDGGTLDAPPNTVIGKVYDRCLQVTGAPTFDRPTDLSTGIVAALLYDDTSATGYKVVPGTGKADGTFEIDNVPDGMEYVLKINTGYFTTTAHVIDQHGEGPFRCDPAPVAPTLATNLTFDVDNMQAYVTQDSMLGGTIDSLEVDSLALGEQLFAFPLNGNTKLATQVNWDGKSTIYGLPDGLLDPSLGDDLELVHTRSELVPDVGGRRHQFTHVLDSLFPTGVAMTNGVDTPVAGTFLTAANNQTLNFLLNRSLYDGGYGPSTAFVGMSIAIVAHPLVEDFGFGGTVATLDFSDWTHSRSQTSGAQISGLAYADPYPAAWHRYESLSYLRQRCFTYPRATRVGCTVVQMSRILDYTGTPVVTPQLLPPTGAKLADQDFAAGGRIAFDGTSPITLKWNAVAQAKMYAVGVRRVVPNGTGSSASIVAVLDTTNTSIKIPAEAFTGGTLFTFTLQAVSSPTDYASGHLTQNGEPSQFAATPSGLFRISADCGNGSIDGDEQCDGMGETAACDVDCTDVACGDGLRNATAGEQCDTAVDTPTCNSSTCKTSACGDGYLNQAAGEDCDDGDTNDSGNGCTSDCKLDNTCGDGVVATAMTLDVFGNFGQVEDCDPANHLDTADCNAATCKFNYCGDGHKNTLAGEQCDDGNQADGDGCSSGCQLE